MKRAAFLICELALVLALARFAHLALTGEIPSSSAPHPRGLISFAESTNPSASAETFSRSLSFPPEADVATVPDETERAWIEAHEDLFDGIPLTRVLDNAGLAHFLYRYKTGAYETTTGVVAQESELESGVPLFLQWDARWGYDAYGEDAIGISGCGPACVAMIVSGLTDDPFVTPRVIADYAMQNDYYLYGTGTKWSLILDACAAYGVEGRQIDVSHDTLTRELNANRALVLNVGRGHFTTTGHFIVVSGLHDGLLIVNDPNSVDNSARYWRYDDVKNEIRAAWSFGE